MLGLVALTATGLAIAGIATYAAERSFLVSRVDQLFSPEAINSFEDNLDPILGLHRGAPRPAPSRPDQFFPGTGREPAKGGPLLGRTVLPPVGTYGIYTAPN